MFSSCHFLHPGGRDAITACAAYLDVRVLETWMLLLLCLRNYSLLVSAELLFWQFFLKLCPKWKFLSWAVLTIVDDWLSEWWLRNPPPLLPLFSCYRGCRLALGHETLGDEMALTTSPGRLTYRSHWPLYSSLLILLLFCISSQWSKTLRLKLSHKDPERYPYHISRSFLLTLLIYSSEVTHFWFHMRQIY